MRFAQGRRLFLATMLTVAIATVATAPAQEPPIGGPPDGGPPGGPPSLSWGLGVAGLAQQQPYTGIDPFYFALPVVYFESPWAQLMGPRLDLKLPGLAWSGERTLTFGLGTQLFGFNGYRPGDAPILSGMAERRNGIFTGPVVKWSSPVVNATAEWMFDVSGNSDGQRFALTLERTWFVANKYMLTPGVAATLLDRNYSDYYYGVRATEGRPGRPAVVVGSTTNADLSLRVDYLLSQHQLLFIQPQYTVYGSGIRDSPLVSRSGEGTVLLGYLYRFR